MNTINQDIWKKVLSKDEEVKEEFSVGDKYRMFYMTIWLVISLPFFAIGLPLLVLFYFLFYVKKANVYAFTNKRVLIHKGWLSTSLVSIDYSKITDVYVSEPFLQRVFTKSGLISIDTAGTGGQEVVLKNVANPYKLKKLLDELKDIKH